ncbi:MAG: S41 family peptidase [Planctomycetota bacterium]
MKQSKLALWVLVAAVLALAVRLPLQANERATVYRTIDPVIDASHLVSRFYYELPDPEVLSQGAIEGMLEALEDPYTEFIPAADLQEFNKQVQGNFVGIGARVRAQDGFVLIFTPMPDSPALKAGIQAGDIVVGVDGTSTYDMALTDVIGMLTGEPGTIVTVTIEREGQIRPEGMGKPSVQGEIEVESGETAPAVKDGHVRFDVEVTRAAIKTPTVSGIHRDDQGDWTWLVDPERRIAYVRLAQFTPGTIQELKQLHDTLTAEADLSGLILDLRFNSGGALEAAIAMSDLFLSQGTIVTVRGRGTGQQTVSAQPEDTLPDIPMAVLVNGDSASASEIVAGALSDNNRAVIIGERTFGKGLVQGIFPLPSGEGQLKLTQGRYYLPSGRLLQREDDSTEWGVDPTPGFYVPMTPEEYRDLQEVQFDEEVIRPVGSTTVGNEADWNDSAWILEHFKDPQLSVAVEAIRTRVLTGQWQAPSNDEATQDEFANMSSKEITNLQRGRDALLRQLEIVEKRITALALVSTSDADDERDLWDDAIALEGGSIQLFDADGNPVTTLRITSNTLERWLADAPVEPVEASDEGE